MAAEKLRKKLMEDTSLFPPGSFDQKDGHLGSPNVPVLTTFLTRKECSERGVHAPTTAGIFGSTTAGAYSICVSSSYEDDKDNGETLIYTGTGGQEDSFGGAGPQVADQTFDHPSNAALKKSVETKYPVRVVRGPNRGSRYAPESGYRYDGLYTVKSAYMGKGRSGYAICKYDLERLPNQPPIPINTKNK
ncbi:hypothetical protein GALMADRAFT_252197 [Galerina marginata CBS 339.88]|uniref:YDG domain-containing protein n=1 Tax=Galerina marginata (strain CBS 339.88) TaxID=685588 RepID=A0A067SPQ1_GALM3|nr:hypothetical protein GALMADRAFT_252197 [Galerina marginata CBS 339.88]